MIWVEGKGKEWLKGRINTKNIDLKKKINRKSREKEASKKIIVERNDVYLTPRRWEVSNKIIRLIHKFELESIEKVLRPIECSFSNFSIRGSSIFRTSLEGSWQHRPAFLTFSRSGDTVPGHKPYTEEPYDLTHRGNTKQFSPFKSFLWQTSEQLTGILLPFSYVYYDDYLSPYQQ